MNNTRYDAPPTTLLSDHGANGGATADVSLRSVIESDAFSVAPAFTAAIGRADDGSTMLLNLKKQPHLLIGGQTGSGKTTLLNTIAVSLAYKNSPDDLKFILIDPKRVEFVALGGLPHCLTDKPVYTPEEAAAVFKWAVGEMERRYELLSKCMCPNIDEYNARDEVASLSEKPLPHIVIMVDEYADLAAPSRYNAAAMEHSIISLAAKARAAGIHVILATQRPSAEVITGSIKCNLTERIGFKMSSLCSHLAFNCPGAENLEHQGEMLCAFSYMPDAVKVKGAYVGMDEVERVVEFLKSNYLSERYESLESALQKCNEPELPNDKPHIYDPIFESALEFFIKTGNASTTVLQRRFSIGYARAARLIDCMEELGYISPSTGNSKPRSVLITQEQFDKVYGKDSDIDECVDFSDDDDDDDSFPPPKVMQFSDDIIDGRKTGNAADSGHVAATVPQFADEQSRALFVSVLKHVAEKGNASTAEVQYSFGLSYVKTLRLFELMEKHGYIGQGAESGFDHEVRITAAQIKELFGE